MNHSAKAYGAMICLICAMATPALAQQPPDVVVSDSMANTAMGTDALLNVNLDESGCHNTATGENALYSDVSGSYNTATGFSSIFSNTTGNNNTAAGYESLYLNSTGSNNTASGYQALYSNNAGNDNTAVGAQALQNLVSGSNNVAIGNGAGDKVLNGSNNINIANAGASDDNGAIRIGTRGTQVRAFIAGIETMKITGSAVYINAAGQLGVLASSERYKTDVQSMGAASERLNELRPVTFKLKSDPEGPVQYGLIAEEVAKVYPELATRDADGRISGVRYEELAPMLLNELKEQQQRMVAQQAVNSAQAAEIRELKERQKHFATRSDLKGLQQQLQTVLAALQSEKQLVARR